MSCQRESQSTLSIVIEGELSSSIGTFENIHQKRTPTF